MTFEERLAAQLYLERRAHAETRRKLAKAEHDRDRYGKSASCRGGMKFWRGSIGLFEPNATLSTTV